LSKPLVMKKLLQIVSFAEDEKLMHKEMASRNFNERLDFLHLLQQQFYKMPMKLDFEMYPDDRNREIIELKRRKN
jgi:hypothetical protein